MGADLFLNADMENVSIKMLPHELRRNLFIQVLFLMVGQIYEFRIIIDDESLYSRRI